MTRAQLDHAMRQVLAQFEVCSHVPAAGYDPRGRSGATDSVDLTGGDKGGHTFWARQYGPPFHRSTVRDPGADSDERRQEVIELAGDELEELRGRTPRITPLGETLEELKKRIVNDGEGFSAKEVAVRMRCGVRLVHAARQEDGRDLEWGRAQQREPDAAARRARAQQMHDDGMTVTQIASVLAVHRSTIERDLGKAGRARAA